MSVINLADRRQPVAYTVRITHHWDDSIEVLVEDVADDERSRQSVADALARAANTFGNLTAPISEEIDQLTREREEHRAEVEGLRAGIERLREQNTLLRDVVMQARRVLVPAFDRIHSLPRTSDTELARAIDIIIEKIRNALVRAASGGKP